MTIPMTPEYRAQIAEMLARPYPTVAAETSVSALLAAGRALLDELVQCETQLAETSADGAQWQARAETAEAEVESLRARVAELEAHPQLIIHADQGLSDDDRKRFAEAMGYGGACDCECMPGEPCLCPERDCYCGPCRVCGENPQQSEDGECG